MSTDSTSRTLRPMHRIPLPESGPPRLTTLATGTPVWLVTRYADVRQVLMDPRFDRKSLRDEGAPPLLLVPNLLDSPDGLLNQDGPPHQVLRSTVQRAFTPRAVARWRPWTASVVETLLDDLARQPQPADIVEAFTRRLPVSVISRLMGLEDAGWERIRGWADHALSGGAHTAEEVGAAMREFGLFCAQLVAERRKEPGDDLVSALVVAGDGLGIEEPRLVVLVLGLVVAGHETTMTALGNIVVHLLTDAREAWPGLAESQEAAETAVEQLLRTIPLSEGRVLPGLIRRAVAEAEVGGVTIPAGAVVAVQTNAANRDPEVFPQPDETDLFAPLTTPSVVFGAGPHHCLGAWLARLELGLALHRLAVRFPGLRAEFTAETIEWREGQMTRGPRRLPVSW
ncbi:cytochrome P450 [Streptomyces griseorubiginosus]|uniref:cytochrome P450 n=1 Tax=Streptomyces griseorubiginosus TaxID=67304 RepID=UPI00076CCB09|nr:cytochrome P450 [Streptomyces griseorubiginosus]KUM80792.1 cytochrome [Streptomyces griseorubiginosus]